MAAGQSAGQLAEVSPDSQVPFPQTVFGAQSLEQLEFVSPFSQTPFPHTGVAGGFQSKGRTVICTGTLADFSPDESDAKTIMVFEPFWAELNCQETEQFFCDPQSKSFDGGWVEKESVVSHESVLTPTLS